MWTANNRPPFIFSNIKTEIFSKCVTLEKDRKFCYHSEVLRCQYHYLEKILKNFINLNKIQNHTDLEMQNANHFWDIIVF